MRIVFDRDPMWTKNKSPGMYVGQHAGVVWATFRYNDGYSSVMSCRLLIGSNHPLYDRQLRSKVLYSVFGVHTVMYRYYWLHGTPLLAAMWGIDGIMIPFRSQDSADVAAYCRALCDRLNVCADEYVSWNAS